MDAKTHTMNFHSIQEIIDDFRDGNMVILVDDEGRENEGDLMMPSALIRPEDINFMARYGRGLICMTMTHERCEQLQLRQMVGTNTDRHGTKFTVSVDAAHGVSTGISAADRAKTLRDAVAPQAKPSDLVQPGHIFPIMAEPGGVLTRAGHTEAGCDLARLAGLEPSSAIVEILNEDGSMARRDDLERFAERHSLKVGTIADLIEYRMMHEKTVERVAQCNMPTRFGEFKMTTYRDTVSRGVHFALVKGDIVSDRPTLIRVHVQDCLCDIIGSLRDGCGWPLSDAMQRVANEPDGGVVVVLRNDESSEHLIHRVTRYAEQDEGEKTIASEPAEDVRTHGMGAQILLDLGVRKMRILSAPKKLHGISGFGLEVEEYVS